MAKQHAPSDAVKQIHYLAAALKAPRITEAAARLAQSCHSCHLEFSPHLVTSPPAPETAPHP